MKAPTGALESFCILVDRLRSINALAVYLFISKSEPCSYSDRSLASALNASGVSTSKSRPFTARVVGLAVDELVSVGLVERREVGRGVYSLSLVSETVLARDENGNGETLSSSININTKEPNKEINKTPARAKRGVWKMFRRERATVATAVRSVDLTTSSLRSFRASLSRIIWEPSLRRELLDRACAAVALKLTSDASLFELARRAVDAASKRGRRIWQVFTLDVKALFDAAGFAWVPTEPGGEPEPLGRVAERRSDEDEEAAVIENLARAGYRVLL